MAAPFYNQTALFYNQIVSPLLLFHVNGASEKGEKEERRRKTLFTLVLPRSS